MWRRRGCSGMLVMEAWCTCMTVPGKEKGQDDEYIL